MFSIVMPLYNKESSVTHAINSVIAQTNENFELIVVDDGSTDNSLHSVKAIKDDRISIVTQANNGVSSARNTGINAAKYRYIAFIDSDDRWHPDYLKAIHSAVLKFPSANWFGTNWEYSKIITDINAWSTGKSLHSSIFQEVNYCQFSMKRTIVNSSSFVATKRCLLDVGLFTVGLKMFEDQELFCKLAQCESLVYTNDVLSYYSIDSENRACARREIQRLPPFFESQLKYKAHRMGTSGFWCREFIIAKVLSEMSLNMQTRGMKLRALKLLYLCRKTRLHRARYLKGWLYFLIPPAFTRWLLRGVSLKRSQGTFGK